MDRGVADSCVFVRWFVRQPGWEHAQEVRDSVVRGDLELHTVDFARVETAHVLRKAGLLKQVMTADQYAVAVRAIDDLGVVVHTIDVDRLERGARLAARRSLGLYDAVFVDLALDLGLPLLTTDAKLCRGVDGLLSTTLLRGSAG